MKVLEYFAGKSRMFNEGKKDDKDRDEPPRLEMSFMDLFAQGYSDKDFMEFMQWVFEGNPDWMSMEEADADAFLKEKCGVSAMDVSIKANECVGEWVR